MMSPRTGDPTHEPDRRQAGRNEYGEEHPMSVAKVIEISAESPVSFEDAIRQGVHRAGETLDDIRSAWVEEQQVKIEQGEITAYRVALKVTFILHEGD
jgi:flavin-binding protein dodecin